MAKLPLTLAPTDAAAAYQRERYPNLSDQRIKNDLPYVFRELPDGSIPWKYDLARVPRFNTWQAIDQVRCPILVVRGVRSDGVSDEAIRAMHAVTPRPECVDIPDAGHNVHLDATAFNQALKAFLARD